MSLLIFLAALQRKGKAKQGGRSRDVESREGTSTLACSSFQNGARVRFFREYTQFENEESGWFVATCVVFSIEQPIGFHLTIHQQRDVNV